MLAVFGAPISFYGKVVDQYGHPVVGAAVHYSAADQYFGDSSKYEGISDKDGIFSITGIKGAGLFVDVFKAGYEGTKQSGGSFGYGMPSGNEPPTRDKPAVLVLRKKGISEPLVVVTHRQFETAKTGRPTDISLTKGKAVPVGQGDVRVETWVHDETRAGARFDWRCRISIPNGGLQERRDDSIFEAPPDGYQQSDEITMPESSATWKRSVSKRYFVKLSGQYARIDFEMLPGGNYNFCVVESYLNPSGSRNLEYDPALEIKP